MEEMDAESSSSSTATGGDIICAGGSVASSDPSECLKLQPKRSILKSGSSFDTSSGPQNSERRSSMTNKEAHFDEMNVLATHHPPDKDYGHMKIDEPKTPYHTYSDSDNEEMSSDRGSRRVSLSEGSHTLNPSKLKKRLMDGKGPKVLEPGQDDPDSDGDAEEYESEDRKAKRLSFEAKRKEHYNEFTKMQEAKKLIEQELAELDNEENG